MELQSDSENGTVSWLEHNDARIAVEELTDGRRRVVIHPNPGTWIGLSECTTAYPPALIEGILRTLSPAYLCDEIMRDEDPDYVGVFLRYSLLGYVSPESFRGARILDFGSGRGASTVVLARMFPDATIVGVELERDLIEAAELRANYYGLGNLEFLQSPDSERLPSDLGKFQFINLGAVYEHLLPAERPRLLSQLWSVLEVGGVLFVNQLPHRFYPIEAHTTGLPLLNYLPDAAAHKIASRFSARIDPQATWTTLLRDGVRGGTARSVRRDIQSTGGHAERLVPTMIGLRDHADLWYAYSTQKRPHPVKRLMRLTFKAISRISGEPFAPGLSLAFQKRA